MGKKIVFETKIHKTTDNKKLKQGETKAYEYGTINIRSPELAKYIGKEAKIEVIIKN